LWLEECLNDLYSAGLQDDKFQLLYNVNSSVNVAVKTPVGKTERKEIRNSVIQGDVLGPIFCSKQVDTIGQVPRGTKIYIHVQRSGGNSTFGHGG
jgi:hypothetical protein